MNNPKNLAESIARDMQILSGEIVGPSNGSCRSVANDLAKNLLRLAGDLVSNDRRFSSSVDCVQFLMDEMDNRDHLVIECDWSEN